MAYGATVTYGTKRTPMEEPNDYFLDVSSAAKIAGRVDISIRRWIRLEREKGTKSKFPYLAKHVMNAERGQEDVVISVSQFAAKLATIPNLNIDMGSVEKYVVPVAPELAPLFERGTVPVVQGGTKGPEGGESPNEVVDILKQRVMDEQDSRDAEVARLEGIIQEQAKQIAAKDALIEKKSEQILTEVRTALQNSEARQTLLVQAQTIIELGNQSISAAKKRLLPVSAIPMLPTINQDGTISKTQEDDVPAGRIVEYVEQAPNGSTQAKTEEPFGLWARIKHAIRHPNDPVL